MSLKKCKECGNEISSKAKTCPQCGAPVIREVSTKTGFLIIIGFVVAIIATCNGQGGNAPKEAARDWRQTDNSLMAYNMMEQFVEKRLATPSTAEFPGVFDGKKDHVTAMADSTYKIVSYVDGQNGFGATIRTRFTGVIKQVSEDEWQLQSLSFQ